METIIYIAFFIILFVTINGILKENFGFGDKGRVVVSTCVSALCLMGLYDIFAVDNSGFIPVLLPYAVLAIGVLTMFFLARICRLLSKDRQEAKQNMKAKIMSDKVRKM